MNCLQKIKPSREYLGRLAECGSSGACPHTRTVLDGNAVNQMNLTLVMGSLGICDDAVANGCSKKPENKLGFHFARGMKDPYVDSYHLTIICRGEDGTEIEPIEEVVEIPPYSKWTASPNAVEFDVNWSSSKRFIETITVDLEVRIRGDSDVLLWQRYEKLSVTRGH